MNIQDVQKKITLQGIDGWLLYDFRHTNDLACNFLRIDSSALLTRRFFYWIPSSGEPIKIVHGIEEQVLDHLPGKKIIYHTWQQLESQIEQVAKGKVAMEYSPRNAIPYISKVDGGTLDLIRSFGVEVVSSADLIQHYTSVLDEKQKQSHFDACDVLDKIANATWEYITDALRSHNVVTEYDVQQWILKQFEINDCITSDPPICAVNSNSANPHYVPTEMHSHSIKPGDFILIDLWCKKKQPGSIYGDITRVGLARSAPTSKEQEIFDIVFNAQKEGTEFISKRFAEGKPVMGCEVDQVCRDKINQAGYGEFFIHRTGHNIGENDHGNGAHIDNYETRDHRYLLPGTCFSIEPGIYLRGQFGIRLEYDVYIDFDGAVHITGGQQENLVCLG